MYALAVKEGVDRTFRKMAKKDRKRLEAVRTKVEQILRNPQQFKPLRSPMQNKRRVHIGPFVLIYEIDEDAKTVTLVDFDHHDRVHVL